MNDRSLNEYFNEVGTLLLKYLLKRGLDYPDAEDIVQNTCYKFLLYMDGIDSRKAVHWMFRVATNEFYDFKRKQKRRILVDIDKIPLQSLFDQPEDQVLTKEKAAWIRSTLERLPPFYQEVLILKYDLGCSYEEMGALLSMNVNTLKTHVYRAKRQFLKCVGKDDGDGEE